MKISIFVACLALLYGTCKIYAEEHVDLIEEVTHDGNYISKPLSTKDLSPSRKKRSLMSPLEMIGSNMLGLGNNALSRFAKIMDSVLLGKNLCSENKSFTDLIEIKNPIQSIKDIICYIFNIIDNRIEHGREIIFDLIWKLFIRILPIICSIMNRIKNTGVLPSQMVGMIEAFDTACRLLKILGYIS